MQPMVNIALRAARGASQKLTRAIDRPDLIKVTGTDTGGRVNPSSTTVRIVS